MVLQALLQAFLVVLHALDGFILGCGCRPDALHCKCYGCGVHLYQDASRCVGSYPKRGGIVCCLESLLRSALTEAY